MVFIPGDLEQGKVITTAVYGGELVAIDGSYDDVNRLCGELVETDEFEDTAFVNVNVRPYYAEGSKTLGYEVAEQLGWRIPAQVVIPMASGELLTKIDKAFTRAGGDRPGRGAGRRLEGLRRAVRRLQPDRHRAARRHRQIIPVKPTGIAKSLNIGDPAAGLVRAGGGAPHRRLDGVRRRRRDPRRASALLARTTGVFAETAGGVTVAVLKKLVESGTARPDGRDGRLQHRRGAEDASTRWPARSGRPTRSSPRCAPPATPASLGDSACRAARPHACRDSCTGLRSRDSSQ